MKTRTTKPNNNPYYITTDKGGFSKCIKGKPTDKGANVLANCVGYANGRFAEIIDENKIKYQFIMNAKSFIKYAKQWGLEISDVPTLGGIMVFDNKKNGGHVCVVEELKSKNSIYTSESSWKGKAFFNKTRNKDENWNMGKNYEFLGCIVNPKIGKVIFEDVKKVNYETQYDMYVRTGPSTKYGVKLVKQMTKDGQKNAVNKNPNALATYKKGTIFTALEIYENNSGTWARTPSGFVCIIGSNGKVYSTKC